MISIICLLRDAPPALLDSVVARVRPGDQVILVDDSGDARALTRVLTMIHHRPWPSGVTVTPIVTDIPAPGDGGIATHLGLEAATAPHVLILDGRSRLTGPLPYPLQQTLLCGPDPDLAQIILPCSALFPSGPRRAEGVAHSDIAFMHALRMQGPVTTTPDRWSVTRATPGPALLDAVADLAGHDPTTADWLADSLPHWLADPAPGARLILQSRPMPLQQILKPAAPPRVGIARVTVRLYGPHAHRTPLAYPHLAPLWADHVSVTNGAADLHVFAHPRDVITLPGNALLLSEEPFWDSLFSPDPLADVITLAPGRLHQLNHHTTALFTPAPIPYFLLTDPCYIRAYQRLFARNAALDAAQWQVRFAARRCDAVFMAEYRSESFHDVTWPEADIIGLCAYRTQLALAATGRVVRQGGGWPGHTTRLDLTDWHGDKLAQLDQHSRLLSGIENTHQPAYLSEKLFDAFAVGSRPLYVASPAHVVHALGLPPKAWVNLHGLTPDQAARTLPGSEDAAFCAAYATAQGVLRDLFSDHHVARARAHIRTHLITDLQRLADHGPA